MNLLVAFDGFYLETSDFHRIKSHLEDKYKVDFTTKLADVFVMRTEDDAVITVKMSGSSSVYNKPPAVAHQAKPAPKTAPAPTEKPPVRAVGTKKPNSLEPAVKRSKVVVTTPSKKRRYPGEDATEKVEEYEEEAGALTQECFGLFWAVPTALSYCLVAVGSYYILLSWSSSRQTGLFRAFFAVVGGS